MTLTIWLSIALILSLGFNLLLFLFSRAKSQQVMAFSENITNLMELVRSYREHISVVAELEMFYGDETLEALIQHTTQLRDILDENYSEYEDYVAEFIIEEDKEGEELDG